MAIVVDKDRKREKIALSCKELILKEGINSISVASLAKEAGIGKGTFYEYFESKDALIFELVNILMQEHNLKKKQKLNSCNSTREKIKEFYSFFYNKDDCELRSLYKEFLSIALISQDEKMIEFKSECFNFYFNWINTLIEDAIKSGELLSVAKDLIKGMYALGEGMFIQSVTTKDIVNLEQDLNKCVDDIFDLIEIPCNITKEKE